MGRQSTPPAIAAPRGHVSNVVPLHRPRINPAHPSIPVPVMFDQDDPDVAAADRCVLLTKVEAAHIATLLKVARAHLPSPKACDEAVRLLVGGGRNG